jgi:hypothetical protein
VKIEEIKPRQSSRDRDVKEEDRNTAYLFAKANQRRRKKVVASLENDGEIITDNEAMLNHAVGFYKSLFGKEPREHVRMDEHFWEESEMVTHYENEMLGSSFYKEEIKKAIDGSYAEGATGPVVFSFLFYQKFWLVIKIDFMAMFRGFEKGEIDIARLNYATIILIPRKLRLEP